MAEGRRKKKLAASIAVVVVVAAVAISYPWWPALIDAVLYSEVKRIPLIDAEEWLDIVEAKSRFGGDMEYWIVRRDTGEGVLRCSMDALVGIHKLPDRMLFDMGGERVEVEIPEAYR